MVAQRSARGRDEARSGPAAGTVREHRSMLPLPDAIAAVLRSLAPGDVVTYGEVAEEAGYPRRARAVGHFLAATDGEFPWWRVVAANGRLAPGHEQEQAARLRAEGVEVDERGVSGMRIRLRRHAAGSAVPRRSSR